MQTLAEIAIVALAVIAMARQSIFAAKSDTPTRRTLSFYTILAVGGFAAASGAGAGAVALLLTAGLALVQSTRLGAWEGGSRTTHSPPTPVIGAIVALAALWAWLATVDLLQNPSTSETLIAYLAAGVIPVLILVVQRSGGIGLWVAASVGTGFQAAAVLVAFLEETRWRPCDEFKCNALGALYTGPFPSENYLAVVSTVTFIQWLSVGRSPGRTLGLLLSGCLILATGSRSALIAVAATVCWCVFIAVVIRRAPQYRRVPAWASIITVTGLVGLSLALLSDARSDTFSNRGNIWIRAYGAVAEDNIVAGLGLSQWEYLQGIGIIPDHFAHSQYLLVLFSGGVIGLFTWVVAFTVLLSSRVGTSRTAVAWAGAPTVAVLVYGLSEVVWNPLALDGFSFLVVGVLGQSWRAHTFVRTGEGSTSAAVAPHINSNATGAALRSGYG